MNNCEAEAKDKWGHTEAYKEFEQRTADYTEGNWNSAANGMDIILAKFAQCKEQGNTPDSVQAQTLVKELQDFITQNFYTCTNEILKGLGVMYVADERFKENIDKHGSGTAEFVSKAIGIY